MINILNEYTNFILDEFCFYGKMIMGKYYNSSIFTSFVKEYLNIRYYNIYPKRNTFNETINFYLNKKVKELENEYPDKTDQIYFMASIFKYLITLDSEIDADRVNKIEVELTNFRKKQYSLEEKIEFSKEYREFKKRKKDFIKNYETNDFFIEVKSTKTKKVYNTFLKHNIKMSELFSEKAIENVYNSGLVSEDKLFVKYNLIAIKVLEEIINYDYETIYLVEFNSDLFKKKEKINRLLRIIDNDIMKEKIIFKIPYTSFDEKREDVYALINNGYNFALIKDEFYKEENYLNLFKFILDKEV